MIGIESNIKKDRYILFSCFLKNKSNRNSIRMSHNNIINQHFIQFKTLLINNFIHKSILTNKTKVAKVVIY
jgi:hypothetical protein